MESIIYESLAKNLAKKYYLDQQEIYSPSLDEMTAAQEYSENNWENFIEAAEEEATNMGL